jgi:tetratricopeptide (TPR) repeat protein
MCIVRRERLREQATMERRYAFYLGEAIRAALAGRHDKSRTHSQTALDLGRELYARSARYRPFLAAALACHAASSTVYRETGEAIALLAESAGHYAVLAREDPVRYEVPRIDVLTRVAAAADAAGNTASAVALLREVVRMHEGAPPAPSADRQARGERELALARARFLLGSCLRKTGCREAALAEIDAGLAAAERAWEHLGLCRANPGWLGGAPGCVQLAVPGWCRAAVHAMTAHAAAGRREQAAAAARVAVRLSAGLAEIGGDPQRQAHAVIAARARALRGGRGIEGGRDVPGAQDCPVSTKRLRETSTSASAAARSAHLMPSTDLPGSRSL